MQHVGQNHVVGIARAQGVDDDGVGQVLPGKDLAARKKKCKPIKPKITAGYLAKYATMATSADTGAVLKWQNN